MSQRQLRVAELIQREVSVALRRNWITESALITITRATISPDLRQVRIGYAVSGGDPEKKAARTFLKRIRRELRAAVSGILQMKNAPELILAEDDVTGGVARVQALLDEMSRKDKPATPADSDE